MLTLPIKKKWFDMIKSGEKKEEYREIKPYWFVRFKNEFGCIYDENLVIHLGKGRVIFKNGYQKTEQQNQTHQKRQGRRQAPC